MALYFGLPFPATLDSALCGRRFGLGPMKWRGELTTHRKAD
jgi:hypothetical protein